MMTIRQTEEFKTWVRGLKDRIAQAVIQARIRRVSAGNFGDAKALGGGIHELRIDSGPGYRVYFTKRGREIVILLCGGSKRTQDGDIADAREIADRLELEEA